MANASHKPIAAAATVLEKLAHVSATIAYCMKGTPRVKGTPITAFQSWIEARWCRANSDIRGVNYINKRCIKRGGIAALVHGRPRKKSLLCPRQALRQGGHAAQRHGCAFRRGAVFWRAA